MLPRCASKSSFNGPIHILRHEVPERAVRPHSEPHGLYDLIADLNGGHTNHRRAVALLRVRYDEPIRVPIPPFLEALSRDEAGRALRWLAICDDAQGVGGESGPCANVHQELNDNVVDAGHLSEIARAH